MKTCGLLARAGVNSHLLYEAKNNITTDPFCIIKWIQSLTLNSSTHGILLNLDLLVLLFSPRFKCLSGGEKNLTSVCL
jgi:hypothetical protein